MAQKKKHLRELLREEQEPFLLKSFIQERRVLLRRRPPSPKKSSTTALVPSTPANAKSPLFLPSNSKTPSLFSLAAKKTPSSSDAINPTAYYILEAALRIQEKQSRKHARTSIRGLGIGFFGSVLKRLVSFRKPRREIQARDVTLSIKDILVWDSPHAGDCRKRIQVTHCLEKRRSASHGDGNHGMEKNEVEDKTFCFSSSEDGRGGTSSCSDENRSPEFESPAASPTCRKPEGQLVSGTGPEEEYDEEQRQEKEQQLSPVSVLDLDPTLEEEEDHLERHVDSYERSLAIVQRAKQQLMHHLRRFQRLTSLDPIELDRLLAEEELDDTDYDLNNSDSHIMLHTHNQCSQLAEEEEEEEEEACSCSPSCVEKSRMDMKKLTMDLIDEEKYTTEKLGEEEEQVLLEKVRQRFEAWKEVESNTIDMMVSLDLRHETQGWGGRCKEQMSEIAALLEAAIFELLIFEFSDELTNYDHHYQHHQQQQQQQLLLVVS